MIRTLFSCSLILAAMCTAMFAADSKVTDLPFGALGDGVTLNTAAIQQAIETCHLQGGGKVIFPAGRYVTGTIELKDNVTLRLEAGAVLLGSLNAADYRNADPFMAGDGIPQGHSLIVAVDAKNVGVEGEGLIDGQGKAVKAAQAKYTVRPFLMRWIRCTGVTIKDVHLASPGAWTLHFFQCQNVTASGLTIRSLGLINNDGIDIDSCQTVRISDCDIDSGDDAICLKATSALPCRDVVVTVCKLKTTCNAIKLGTESLGDFENIRVSNCQAREVGMAGIALYSVDGAHLHDVIIEDFTVDGVAVPVSIRLGARLKTFRAGDQAKTPGTLRNVTIRNIRATGIRRIGLLINGIPGHPVSDLTLENIDLTLPGGGKAEDALVQLAEKESTYPEYNMFGKVMPASGAYVRHVRGVKFKNVRAALREPDARPAAVFIDVEGATPADFLLTPAPAIASPSAAKPAAQAWPADKPAFPAVLPGKGLAQHDFFYAGEAKTRDMYIVRGGKIVWSYHDPEGRGEISDARLLPNGNILFAHQFRVALITPEKKVIWEYLTPPKTEVHTAQFIDDSRVFFVQNGDPAKLIIVNVVTGKAEKEFPLPVGNPKGIHGQFRHAEFTDAGTFLIAHMDMGKICEYDTAGLLIWSYEVGASPWSAKRLKNGNTLICGSQFTREVNPRGATVWELTPADVAEYKFNSRQIATRLPNGNTLINHWTNQWSEKIDSTTAAVQALEVTPDKKVVWALRSWDEPANLGPSTIIQLLD